MNWNRPIAYGMAASAAVAVVAVVTFAVGRDRPLPAPPEQPAAVKGDRIDVNEAALLAYGRSKLVETIRIIPTTPPEQPAAPVEPPPAPPPPKPAKPPVVKQAEAGDICTRHRMHKVWTDKYRWRCRK